ncbi:hypothetical protein [Halosimplex sp. TS25]|uniref:hypothetical protein n=1 Tax=Halosimplex rarum TaxID=3396619 RepID=UPI0039EB6AB5
MTTLTVYNTNGAEVASEGSDGAAITGDIQRFIDNQIEYYVDTNRPTVIALVRADAPQVKGRDIANFWAAYRGDDAESLPTELVAQLDHLAANEGWTFYTEDPRFAVPWSLAQAGVQSPEDLNIDMGPLFTVKRLIEDHKCLDFGFRGYEQAARALDYFLRAGNDHVEYAVASNGRIGPISDTELVLVPGHDNNFDILTEATRTHISSRYAELESETKSYYQDQTIASVETLAEDADLSPVRTLEELHRLERYFADSTGYDGADSDFYSEHSQAVVTRTDAIQSGTAIGNAPSPAVLGRGTRDDMIADIRDAVTETRRTYAENLDEYVRAVLDERLRTLGHATPSTELVGLRAVEDRLFEDPATAPADPPEPAKEITALVTRIEDTSVLPESEKSELAGLIRSRVANRKSQLRSEVEDDLRNRIRSWIDGLPPEDSTLALRIARKTETLQTAIRNPDRDLELDQTLSRSSESFTQLVRRLHSNEIIEEHTRSRLLREFCDDLSAFESDVVEQGKAHLRAKTEDELDQLQEDTRPAEEYAMVSQRRSLFSQHSTVDQPQLEGLAEIVETIDEEPLFTSEEREELRSHVRRALRSREKQLEQEEKEKFESRTNYYRKKAVESQLESGRRADAIDVLESVERYLNGWSSARSLPDTLRTSYRNKLRVLAGDDEHEFLSDEDLEEISANLADARADSLTELREDEYEEVRRSIDAEVKELCEALNDDPEPFVTVLKHLRDYARKRDPPSDGAAELPDTSQSMSARVQRIRRLADRAKDPEDVLTRDHQRRLRQHLKSTLDSSLDAARDDFVDDRVTRLTEFLESEYALDDPTLEDVDESIESLDAIESAVRGEEPDASIPDAAAAWIEEMDGDLVDDSHEAEFEDRAVSAVDAVRADLEQRKDVLLRAEVDSEITEIVNGDGPMEAKIRELRDLASVVNPETIVQSPGLDSSVVSKCRSLTEETRTELHSHVKGQIRSLSEMHTDSLVDDIVQDLEEVLQKVTYPRNAVETFEDYVNGNASITDSSELRPVCDEFDRLERLRDDGVVSRSQFESARKELLEEVVALKGRYGPDSLKERFVYNVRTVVWRVRRRTN